MRIAICNETFGDWPFGYVEPQLGNAHHASAGRSWRVPNLYPGSPPVPIPGVPFSVVWPQQPGFPRWGLTGQVSTGQAKHPGQDGRCEIVAAKFFDPKLSPKHPDWHYLQTQFLAEAGVSAGLGGDHVIRTLGYNRELDDPWRPVIVMEFADASVFDLINECRQRHRRLSFKVVQRIASGAARGIEAFHDAGLVHRDIKPGNLFIKLARGFCYVDVAHLDKQLFKAKVGDAGFAMRVSQCQHRWFEQDGYKPDELLCGGVSDPRSDIFGFGRTLEELIKFCHVVRRSEELLLEHLLGLQQRCTASAVDKRPLARDVVRQLADIGSEMRRLGRRGR